MRGTLIMSITNWLAANPRSSPRLQSLRPPLPPHLYRGIPVNQLPTFGLRETLLDMRSDRLALFEHPVFEFELFADDLKCLIDHFARSPVSAGLDRQIDDTLLLRLQVNHHVPTPPRNLASTSWEQIDRNPRPQLA